jgi:hypothetical protein
MPRKVVLLLAAAAALVFAVAAYGHGRDDGKGNDDDNGRGKAALSASLAPSVPTDVAIHGIAPGGVPGVLTRGSVRVKRDGELDLRLRGLIIPTLGTAGPVTTVSASLLCGLDTAPAATTGAVPLSSSGDARIDTRIALPPTCLAPAVVVHPNGNTKAYIAVSGWKP